MVGLQLILLKNNHRTWISTCRYYTNENNGVASIVTKSMRMRLVKYSLKRIVTKHYQAESEKMGRKTACRCNNDKLFSWCG